MHPSADDPGSKPRASDEPADAGMNKDTRCNTVALDLDAVRTIAKASRSAPGEPDPQPKAESPAKLPRKEPSAIPTSRDRPSAPAKVIVQPAIARAAVAKPQSSSTEKPASAPVAPGVATTKKEAPSAPIPAKPSKEASPPPASAGVRAVLLVACACLALLLVLTWRLVVAPVEPAGPVAAQAAHGASRTPAEASDAPAPTSAPRASVTTSSSTTLTTDLPPVEESTKPTAPVVSPPGTGAAPSFLAPSVPRPSGSTTAITIPYQ